MKIKEGSESVGCHLQALPDPVASNGRKLFASIQLIAKDWNLAEILDQNSSLNTTLGSFKFEVLQLLHHRGASDRVHNLNACSLGGKHGNYHSTSMLQHVAMICYAHDEPMLQSAPSSPSALHLCWGQTCSPPILPTCSNIVRGLKSCSFRTSQTWSCLTDVCFCCCFFFQVEGLFLRIGKHNFMDRFKVGCNWKGTPITSVRRQLEVP